MRIAFLSAFVIGCGLLMICEVGYADTIPLALADPTNCGAGQTPGGVVTCNIGSPGGGISPVTNISPTVGDVLVGSTGSNQVIIGSTQEMNGSSTGASNKITASQMPLGSFPLTNVTFTGANNVAYSVYGFTIDTNAIGGVTCSACAETQVVEIDALPVSAAGVAQPLETFLRPISSSGNTATNLTVASGFFMNQVSLVSETGIAGIELVRIGGQFSNNVIVQPPPIPEIVTPEPDTLPLLGFGLAGFGLCLGKLRRWRGGRQDFLS